VADPLRDRPNMLHAPRYLQNKPNIPRPRSEIYLLNGPDAPPGPIAPAQKQWYDDAQKQWYDEQGEISRYKMAFLRMAYGLSCPGRRHRQIAACIA